MNYTQSGRIKANANAHEFKQGVKGYYQYAFGSGCTVNKTMYDADGFETENATLATEAVYFISLTKLIDGMSIGSVIVSKVSTSS